LGATQEAAGAWAGSAVGGKRLDEVDLPDASVVVGILRGGDLLSPHGFLVFAPGDEILAVARGRPDGPTRQCFRDGLGPDAASLDRSGLSPLATRRFRRDSKRVGISPHGALGRRFRRANRRSQDYQP